MDGLFDYIIASTALPEGNDQRPHVPLMSLQRFLVPITTPSSVPYLTLVNRSRASETYSACWWYFHWSSWASNPDNKAMYRNKSISLERWMLFTSALQLNLIELHCMQFGADRINPIHGVRCVELQIGR